MITQVSSTWVGSLYYIPFIMIEGSEMHKRTEGEKVGHENGMVHIPTSQSILELAVCEGLGYVSEKFYSLPPVPAYLKTYEQLLYLCILFSVIPCTHSHASTYIHNLFSQFTEKIKPADWKRLHFCASRSVNLPELLPLISYYSSGNSPPSVKAPTSPTVSLEPHTIHHCFLFLFF